MKKRRRERELYILDLIMARQRVCSTDGLNLFRGQSVPGIGGGENRSAGAENLHQFLPFLDGPSWPV